MRLFIPLSPWRSGWLRIWPAWVLSPWTAPPLLALLPSDLKREIQTHLPAFRLVWHMAQLHKGVRHGYARLV